LADVVERPPARDADRDAQGRCGRRGGACHGDLCGC
jgi:hypothetical protein